MVHDIISEIKKLFPEDHRFFLHQNCIEIKIKPQVWNYFQVFSL
jgi:hypothetical protein